MSVCVSLIVPAYNACLSLERAVSSIFKSLSGHVLFEVIIVNDGSLDETQQVAELCRSRFGHDLIRVIQQQNSGVSAARNAGIRVARGEFLAFLDADDELTALAGELLSRAVALDSDIVEFGYILRRESGESKLCFVSDVTPESTRLALSKSILLSAAKISKWYPWARLYRAGLFSERLFREGLYFEDFEFLPWIYRKAVTIASIRAPLVIYISTPGSITRVAKKKYADDLLFCARQFYSQSKADKEGRGYWAFLAQRAYFVAMQAASNARIAFDEGAFNDFRRDHVWTLWTTNLRYIKYFVFCKSIMLRKIRRKERAGKALPVLG
jgi:glycosyltransferase involved in cell wall biosynthesis